MHAILSKNAFQNRVGYRVDHEEDRTRFLLNVLCCCKSLYVESGIDTN